jgi:low affinity Fe/Cu permease
MSDRFQQIALKVSDAVGTHQAFLVALLLVLAWGATGPLFHFSDSWQLVINTGTTVVTFLMVFLIQATQNRETRALHLKLDELILSQQRARNIFAGLEHATEDELKQLDAEFRKVRARARARVEPRTGSRGE